MGNTMSATARKRQAHTPRPVKARKSPRRFGFTKKQHATPVIENTNPRRTRKFGFDAGSKRKPAAVHSSTKPFALRILKAKISPTSKTTHPKKNQTLVDKLTPGIGSSKHHHQASPTKKRGFGRRTDPIATVPTKRGFFSRRKQ